MDSKSRLVAAVTTSGTMLCLTLAPSAGHAAARSDTIPEPLAQRVQQLTDRVNAAMPVDDVSRAKLGREPGRIENVVQFFNFSNSNRRGR